MKAIKSDNDSDRSKKGRQVFQKNGGVTPSVATPGVTQPSDATAPHCESHTHISHVCCRRRGSVCYLFLYCGLLHCLSVWIILKVVDEFRAVGTRAVPERLRDVFTTRRYTNPPYLTFCS